MAHVGQGTTHKNQVSDLDAEIAALEANFGDEGQQPSEQPQEAPRPEEQLEAAGDGTVEAITTVDEFVATQDDGKPEEQSVQEEHQVAPQPQVQEDLLSEAEPQKGTGRRSWKNDYLELENRYTRLRQTSDQFKYEAKQQLAYVQQQLVMATDENDKLKQQLLELHSASQKQNVASVFSQEDVDVLGESTVANVQNAIQTAVDSATQPLQAELMRMKKNERDRLKSQAEANRNQAYATFEQRLARLVPDYPTINVNPEFIKWLKTPSVYGGAPRIKYLHQAETAGDVERVAQFFVEWKAITEAPQRQLEEQVAPTGRGGGGGAPRTTPQPQQQGKRIFTQKFIDQFYQDDIDQKYVGREALRDQLDKEIDLALQEGRVVY